MKSTLAFALVASLACAGAAAAQNAAGGAQPTGPNQPAAASPVAAGPAAPAVAALPSTAGPTSTAAKEEAALLALIAGIQSNNPDYNTLAPHLAAALRGQLAAMNARMGPRGPVEGVDLLGDGPDGVERFKVRYARESSEWGLSLGPDGKINGLTVKD